MNTNGLAKHYHRLTPWERLPLIIAAADRGDLVERDRLVQSARLIGFRLPNYWGLARALRDLAIFYQLEQLNLGTYFGELMNLLKHDPRLPDNQRSRREYKRLWQVAEIMAYRFVVRADGWKLLCAELHIDADVLLRDLAGYQKVREIEDTARLMACTPEQARAFFRNASKREKSLEGTASADPDKYRLETPEEQAQAMRQHLDEKLAAWS
jgi:hypothetical protein